VNQSGPDQDKRESREDVEDLMLKAAVIAMVIGVVVAAYLIWLNSQESYSALYIYPGSYSNYINTSELPKEISFIYGIKSYETRDKTYKVSIFLGDKLIKSKEIEIKRGETFEENESIVIPVNTTFPAKIRVVAEVEGVVYEVHFWLKEITY